MDIKNNLKKKEKEEFFSRNTNLPRCVDYLKILYVYNCFIYILYFFSAIC